jgi:hypothetical protein
MSDSLKDNTPQTEEAQPKRRATPIPSDPAVTQLQTIDLPPREYDIPLIDHFLDTVFQAGLDDDEQILTWAVSPGKTPAYPKPDASLTYTLARTKKPMALYFGTSTAYPEGANLFNRKSLWSRMFVLVLDDIGTKVPIEKIPESFKPTYVIESSEGNYQYGYVLKEPIEDYDQAATLVQLVYEAGYSDCGGKMPNKLVRLPEGVNGKKGKKRGFVSKLVEINPKNTYSCDEILHALSIPIEWKEVVEDSVRVQKERAKLHTGASSWCDDAQAPTMNGIIDPILEWLYDNDEVINDNGTWVTVPCPWADLHTSDGDTAGYMPLGRGDDPKRRGFHCVHEHCITHTITDYLYHLAENHAPEVPVKEIDPEMVSTWVYNAGNDSAWKIKNSRFPISMKLSAFKEVYTRKLPVVVRNAQKVVTKMVPQHAVWSHNPARVVVYGETFDPTTTARLVEMDGHKYINKFTPPDWPNTANDAERHLNKFLEFTKYLIPEDDDREYVFDWIAAKVQNMGFRGAALVMVAPRHGTGRTTFTDMLETMFGNVNVTKVEFEDIITEKTPFNEWMASPLVMTNETLNSGAGFNFFRAYEKLKGVVDTRPQPVVINPKYGQKYTAIAHSSFIFLSNHANALALDSNDRRFYVMRNASEPASPEYFTELNRWLNEGVGAQGDPDWCPVVWHWFKQREIDIEKLLAPPPVTAHKRQMMLASQSNQDALAQGVLSVWPVPFVSVQDVMRVAMTMADRIRLHNITNGEGVVKRLIQSHLTSFTTDNRVVLDGKQIRPKVITRRMSELDPCLNPHVPTSEEGKKMLRAMMAEPLDYAKIERDLSDALALIDL